MSQKVLEIPIQCGETTCAYEPGKFCPQLRVSSFGRDYSCKLFSEQGYKGRWDNLEEKNGWLQRHPECLKLERRADGLLHEPAVVHQFSHQE